jgi:hypothetical protein
MWTEAELLQIAKSLLRKRRVKKGRLKRKRLLKHLWSLGYPPKGKWPIGGPPRDVRGRFIRLYD